MMVDLGLHQDLPKSVKMKDGQLELRRRIYYSVYALDLYVSDTLVEFSHSLMLYSATTMIHRRACSFTVDSTNVELPRLSSITLHRNGNSSDNAHAAIELIRLCQAASEPYMALFQSSLEILRDPWPTLCSAHLALDRWEQDLRQTRLREATKSLFRAEMLYIKIVLLSPSRLERPLEDYGQSLIFEHAVQYSQILSSLIKDRVDASLCTSYDLLRTILIAQRFVEILTRYGESFFRDSMPPLPKTSVPTNFPLLTSYPGRERLALAVEACSLLENAIGILGRRYGTPKAWMDFRPRFDRVFTSLRSRIGS